MIANEILLLRRTHPLPFSQHRDKGLIFLLLLGVGGGIGRLK